MKYFQKLADNVDVLPTLHALKINDHLWDQNTLRTKHPGTAHSQVSDILVWFNEMPNQGDLAKVMDDRDVVPYPAWSALPTLRPIIFGLMRQTEAVRLGRVIITRLPPGKTITPHVDGGAPAEYYSRYQVVLQSYPGALFKIGDEVVNFASGQIWWINNRIEHSVVNNSTDDRIVLIVDLRIG